MESSPILKMLTLEAVWDAAETLIFQHGETTGKAVRQQLCQQLFCAEEPEVEQALAHLAQEDNWGVRKVRNVPRYYFVEDSEECIHLYLEKGKLFWEIALLDKAIYTATGVVGQLGQHLLTTYDSNRYAYLQLRKMLAEREAADFVEAEDVRPDWVIRLPFWSNLNYKPRSIRLFYRDPALQEEPQFRVFTLKPNRMDCVELLSRAGYDPLAITLPAATNLPLPPDSWVANTDLHQVVLTYASGETLRLHREHYPTAADFLMRVRLLVSQ